MQKQAIQLKHVQPRHFHNKRLVGSYKLVARKSGRGVELYCPIEVRIYTGHTRNADRVHVVLCTRHHDRPVYQSDGICGGYGVDKTQVAAQQAFEAMGFDLQGKSGSDIPRMIEMAADAMGVSQTRYLA